MHFLFCISLISGAFSVSSLPDLPFLMLAPVSLKAALKAFLWEKDVYNLVDS